MKSVAIILELTLAVAIAFFGVGLFKGLLQSFPFGDPPFGGVVTAFIAGSLLIASAIFLGVDVAARMKRLYR